MVTDKQPVITIIGCGYVGLTLAAVLANTGSTVYALEVDPKRLAAIKQGRSFFYEAGADPLIAAGIASGNLIPTESYEVSIPHSSVVFSCVGTPDNPDGSSNLSYVFEAVDSALPLMKDGTVYAQKSTVPVSTGARLEERFAASGKNIAYVSAPEFVSMDLANTALQSGAQLIVDRMNRLDKGKLAGGSLRYIGVGTSGA